VLYQNLHILHFGLRRHNLFKVTFQPKNELAKTILAM